MVQVVQRWLRICWKWSTFWKACNKRSTWECWTCTGCNQQRSAADSVRTRSSSGDSKNYSVWDFDAGSWHETMSWQNSFHGFCYQSRRSIVLQLLMTWFKVLPGNQISSRGFITLGTEASLSCVQCFLYLVSSSVNVSIFHSMWLDTFWTDCL